MARINIEDSLWTDPRFTTLIEKVGMVKAIGYFVLATRAAQECWKRGRMPIPKRQAEKMLGFQELFDSDLLVHEGEDYYLVGTKSQHDWLTQRLEAAKKGGKSSAKKKTQSKQGGDVISDTYPEANESKAVAEPEQAEPSYSYSNSTKSAEATPLLGPELLEKSTSPRKKAPKKSSRFKASSKEEVLKSLSKRTIDTWKELYPDTKFLNHSTTKAISWYLDRPNKMPVTARGWSTALGRWLEKDWFKWSRSGASQGQELDWDQVFKKGNG